MPKIIPAILAKNAKEFKRKLLIIDGHAEEAQIDIMDGEFVPEISSEDPETAKLYRLLYSLHLMVADPEKYIEKWKAVPGVRQIIIHAEIKKPLELLIQKIKNSGWEVGLAINPETSHESIDKLIPLIDIVLVMSVNPGKSGQSFETAATKEHLLSKITLLHEEHPGLEISSDGGVNSETLPLLLRAGVTNFVIGSAIFDQKEPLEALKKLKHLIRQS